MYTVKIFTLWFSNLIFFVKLILHKVMIFMNVISTLQVVSRKIRVKQLYIGDRISISLGNYLLQMSFLYNNEIQISIAIFDKFWIRNGLILRLKIGSILDHFGHFFANFSHVIFREKSFAWPFFVFAKNAKNCAALIATKVKWAYH